MCPVVMPSNLLCIRGKVNDVISVEMFNSHITEILTVREKGNEIRKDCMVSVIVNSKTVVVWEAMACNLLASC
jgi:hypothetical protein